MLTADSVVTAAALRLPIALATAVVNAAAAATTGCEIVVVVDEDVVADGAAITDGNVNICDEALLSVAFAFAAVSAFRVASVPVPEAATPSLLL